MSVVNVPISTATFLKLAGFLKDSGSDRDPAFAVEDAVEYWLENARWKTADLLPETVHERPRADYIWRAKDKATRSPLPPVVLPHGTVLQLSTSDGIKQATVDDGRLLFEGAQIRSPNAFAEAAAGHARDAWRDVYVRRPTDRHYILADDLREQNRKQKGTP